MNLNIKIKKASISWIIQAISELSNLPALTDFFNGAEIFLIRNYYLLDLSDSTS